MIKHILASAALVMVLGLGSLPALAQSAPQASPAPAKTQAPIGDEELKKFVGAAKKLEVISKERNNLVVQTVQKEGLSIDRFREIYQSKKDPKAAKPAPQVSNDEQQKYDRAITQLAQLQKDIQAKMGSAVQSEGLEVPRFLQILEAIQKTPELQKKVESLLKAS
jgi:DNA-binding transcriptional MerR regulator